MSFRCEMNRRIPKQNESYAIVCTLHDVILKAVRPSRRREKLNEGLIVWHCV